MKYKVEEGYAHELIAYQKLNISSFWLIEAPRIWPITSFGFQTAQIPNYHLQPKHILSSTTFATSNHKMASTKPLTMLVARSRPVARLTNNLRTFTPTSSPLAAFSTSSLRYATPMGPPPAGFRLPKPARWDESKESTMDKAGKYFLLTEMARGMYVVLEQYFRPP